MDLSKRTTAEVLQHHLDVLGAGDVEATLLDYAADAFIITADGVTRGLTEIRKFFTNSVENVLPPGSDFEMRQKIVEGEVALIVWSAESPKYRIPFGTDTFIIRAGQIVEQTFTGVVNQK
jgi:ketosteroid isomerase-like protein